MIQRIQSLYLLLAAALLAVTIFTPIATFAGGGEELTLSAFSLADGAGELVSTRWMGILLACSAILPFVTIFLYKNRPLQIRLCGVELVLLLGCAIYEIIYCWLTYDALAEKCDGAMMVKVGAVMPLVAIVLVALAMRGIFRDELLVRSLDRIR